jgi:hypothetical protein
MTCVSLTHGSPPAFDNAFLGFMHAFQSSSFYLTSRNLPHFPHIQFIFFRYIILSEAIPSTQIACCREMQQLSNIYFQSRLLSWNPVPCSFFLPTWNLNQNIHGYLYRETTHLCTRVWGWDFLQNWILPDEFMATFKQEKQE